MAFLGRLVTLKYAWLITDFEWVLRACFWNWACSGLAGLGRFSVLEIDQLSCCLGITDSVPVAMSPFLHVSFKEWHDVSTERYMLQLEQGKETVYGLHPKIHVMASRIITSTSLDTWILSNRILSDRFIIKTVSAVFMVPCMTLHTVFSSVHFLFLLFCYPNTHIGNC